MDPKPPPVARPPPQYGPRAPIKTDLRQTRKTAFIGVLVLVLPAICLTWLAFYIHAKKPANPMYDGSLTQRDDEVLAGALFASFLFGLIGLVLLLSSVAEVSGALLLQTVLLTLTAWFVALAPAAFLLDGYFPLDWGVCTLWFMQPPLLYTVWGIREPVSAEAKNK